MIDYASRQRGPRKHIVGLTVVVVLHGLLFWAINSGLARKFVKVIKGPVEAVLFNWNGRPVAGRADLEAKLTEASGLQPQPELHIRSHAKAKYESVALVMASAQRLGLNKLGIVGSEQFVN